MSTTVNFLALESVLKTRLQTHFAASNPAVQVLSAVDLAGVTEASQLAPAVHLVYQGYRVAETPTHGRVARIEQTWLVVIATRNVSDARTGEAARSQAGAIASQVCTALMGWNPSAVTKPLQLSDAPAAGFLAGFAYLPLAFVTEIVLG